RPVGAACAPGGSPAGTLDNVTAGMTRPPGLRPRRKLVLTFDDGTADFLEHALPVLQEFHFSATLFIVAGLIGGQRSWQHRAGDGALAPVPLMTAADLRRLAG